MLAKAYFFQLKFPLSADKYRSREDLNHANERRKGSVISTFIQEPSIQLSFQAKLTL